MSNLQKLQERSQAAKSFVCVGLDSELSKIPASLQKAKYPQFEFNKAIIDATAPYICSFKPNMAFYEARGEQGIHELKMTLEYLQEKHPDIFTICDAKRADIGSTNEGYVKSVFDWYGFDAITLHPYLGQEALKPFLDRQDKTCIILCRTSNPGAGEFQDLQVEGSPLWKHIAKTVSQKWNEHNNCMLVVGATYPEEMAQIRQEVGEMTFLIPGVGAQGGDVEKTVKAGVNSSQQGMIINSSRGIIFASQKEDFAEIAGKKADELRQEINKWI
jgi:orotidine-5'-phosphate decarboxylase